MATFSLDQMRKQASSFLHEKYRNARLVFTDVTEAELLVEEATNNDSLSPNARTMTRIAEASFDIDDYWRVVDILHRRLYKIDWKKWRQSYNSLVLLEFLMTHGPEEFADEFLCDVGVIEELGTFKHKDEKGFDWGLNMQKKSDRIIELLHREDALRQARLKALKVTREIQGFGNLIISPASSSSSSSSSRSSQPSSFSSYSTTWSETDEANRSELSPLTEESIECYTQVETEEEKHVGYSNIEKNIEGTRDKSASLIEFEGEDYGEKFWGVLSGIKSKFGGGSTERGPLRSFSDVGNVMEKKIDRQLSFGN
ncbi:hypothetical protein LguiB_025924 [Lonicera macranthoides]